MAVHAVDAIRRHATGLRPEGRLRQQRHRWPRSRRGQRSRCHLARRGRMASVDRARRRVRRASAIAECHPNQSLLRPEHHGQCHAPRCRCRRLVGRRLGPVSMDAQRALLDHARSASRTLGPDRTEQGLAVAPRRVRSPFRLAGAIWRRRAAPGADASITRCLSWTARSWCPSGRQASKSASSNRSARRCACRDRCTTVAIPTCCVSKTGRFASRTTASSCRRRRTGRTP